MKSWVIILIVLGTLFIAGCIFLFFKVIWDQKKALKYLETSAIGFKKEYYKDVIADLKKEYQVNDAPGVFIIKRAQNLYEIIHSDKIFNELDEFLSNPKEAKKKCCKISKDVEIALVLAESKKQARYYCQVYNEAFNGERWENLYDSSGYFNDSFIYEEEDDFIVGFID